MPNFPNTFETSKQLIITAFSTCMTVPLNIKLHVHNVNQSVKEWINSLCQEVFKFHQTVLYGLYL